MKKIGIITIGQSPRTDVVPEMAAFLGPDVQILEAGAIDDLESKADLAAVAPQAGETVLVSRLRDGREVLLGEERLLTRIQACIHQLEEAEANPLLLLCTGRFPPFSHQGLLLEPDRLLVHLVTGVLGTGGKLGVVVPRPEQEAWAREKWAPTGLTVVTASGSPYGPPSQVVAAAQQLKERAPDLIVLDCMGFRAEHKALVLEHTGIPTLLSNAAVARVLAELAG